MLEKYFFLFLTFLCIFFDISQTPSDVSWGSYRVNITGSGGVGFENSTTLWGRPKSLSIFVQTDKAKYKPGDTGMYCMFDECLLDGEVLLNTLTCADPESVVRGGHTLTTIYLYIYFS